MRQRQFLNMQHLFQIQICTRGVTDNCVQPIKVHLVNRSIWITFSGSISFIQQWTIRQLQLPRVLQPRIHEQCIGGSKPSHSKPHCNSDKSRRRKLKSLGSDWSSCFAGPSLSILLQTTMQLSHARI